MKVFKFGGGVLKSKNELIKLVDILKKYDTNNIIVVISAFNKVSNMFELLLNSYFKSKTFNKKYFEDIKKYHLNLVSELFNEKTNPLIIKKTKTLLVEINEIFNAGLSEDYHFEYDRIVSYGELLSSLIIFEYLTFKNLKCKYIDSRKLIVTDSVYTEAKINWDLTKKNIREKCTFKDNYFCITQGFIASDVNGNTTTLGREGSDFTASIFSYILDVEEVIFWKEVDGIYNSDPAISTDFKLLPKLSYRESVEQTYYGAKILHPKTIKPLQNKKIPITVRSFYNDNEKGTNIIDISELSPELYPNIPIFIVKENQILISVSTIDFSFISEYNLGEIFSLLSEYRIKVNLMQSSAINFSVCVTNNKYKVPKLIERLKQTYNVRYNDILSLVTIRHYDNSSINKMIKGKQVLVEQKSRHTARFVIK